MGVLSLQTCCMAWTNPESCVMLSRVFAGGCVLLSHRVWGGLLAGLSELCVGLAGGSGVLPACSLPLS